MPLDATCLQALMVVLEEQESLRTRCQTQSAGLVDAQSSTFQRRTGRKGRRVEGGMGGPPWRAKEAESNSAGYRITQIILPQRSIPQELFAARLQHKSAPLPPTQLMFLLSLYLPLYLYRNTCCSGTTRRSGQRGARLGKVMVEGVV